jgi:hypothetical protein
MTAHALQAFPCLRLADARDNLPTMPAAAEQGTEQGAEHAGGAGGAGEALGAGGAERERDERADASLYGFRPGLEGCGLDSRQRRMVLRWDPTVGGLPGGLPGGGGAGAGEAGAGGTGAGPDAHAHAAEVTGHACDTVGFYCCKFVKASSMVGGEGGGGGGGEGGGEGSAPAQQAQ